MAPSSARTMQQRGARARAAASLPRESCLIGNLSHLWRNSSEESRNSLVAAKRVPVRPALNFGRTRAGLLLFGTAFHTSGRSQLCAHRAEADSRSTAPTDGFGPPMHRHRAYVWLGDAADPLRALPTSASSAVKFSCTACDARIDGAVYMARDMPYCCEAHRDGPRRRSALLFPSSNSTVQFAPLHHLQPRVRSSSSGDLADVASTPKRRRSSVDATSPSDRESPEPP